MAIELHVLAQLLQLKSYDLITEQLKARGSFKNGSVSTVLALPSCREKPNRYVS
jgi:hypothetical protein